jgi:diguanylate cyclase (GGDEF)-like protein
MNALFATNAKSTKAQPQTIAAQFAEALNPDATLRPKNMREADVMLAVAEKTINNLQERIQQLENLALTDELTGLCNRRGLMAALQRELALAEREPQTSGLLILCDLNGFKLVNDTHGHAAGDAYLRSVAAALVETVRPSDIVARIGGDEFALLLHGIDHEQAATRLERIDHSFHTQSMTWQGRVLPLRASFGAAQYARGANAEDLLATADLRLYAQKSRRKGELYKA